MHNATVQAFIKVLKHRGIHIHISYHYYLSIFISERTNLRKQSRTIFFFKEKQQFWFLFAPAVWLSPFLSLFVSPYKVHECHHIV